MKQYLFDVVAPSGQAYTVKCSAKNEAVAHYVICGEYPNWHVADKAKEEHPAHHYVGEIDASEGEPYYPRLGKCTAF